MSMKTTNQSSISMTINNSGQKLKLEQSLIERSNETIARINLEIANMYKVTAFILFIFFFFFLFSFSRFKFENFIQKDSLNLNIKFSTL